MDTCKALQDVADEVTVVSQPEDFRAVGRWYLDFDQTADDQVKKLLGKKLPPVAAA